MSLIFKASEMLYYIDLTRQDWSFAFDGCTLIQVLRRGDLWPRPPRCRELTDPEVELHCLLNNSRGTSWGSTSALATNTATFLQGFVSARVQRAAASPTPPAIQPWTRPASGALADCFPLRLLRRLSRFSLRQRPRRLPLAAHLYLEPALLSRPLCRRSTLGAALTHPFARAPFCFHLCKLLCIHRHQ